MLQRIYNVEAFLAQQRARGFVPLLDSVHSRVAYAEAGATLYQFFQEGFGDSNQERTSLPAAGRLNHPFLVQSIECTAEIKDWDHDGFVGIDASTLASDVLLGFVQGGVFRLSSQGTQFLQVEQPLMEMPRRSGYPVVRAAGMPKALILTEATPNTYPGATVSYPPAPHVTPAHADDPRPFLLDPPLFIPQDQPFKCEIAFPAGAIAVIGTGVTDDSSNPLRLQVKFRGYSMKPRG